MINLQKDTISFLLAFDKKTGQLDSNKLISEALQFLTSEFDLKRSSIAMLAPWKDRFILKEVSFAIEEMDKGRYIPFAFVHLPIAIQTLKPVYRPDIKTYKPKFKLDEKLIEAGIQSDYIIPLIVEETCIGTLNCGSKNKDGISQQQQQLLQLIAPKLAMALRNAKLHEELQANAKKFKNLLNSMDDLVFVIDAEDRFAAYYSSEDKLIIKPEDFLGKKHEDIFPPSICEKFNKALQTVKKGKTAEYEYELDEADGLHWYLAKLTPMFEEGKYTGLSVVSRDITKRKNVDDALKESESQLRLITENTSDNISITTFDQKATSLYVNPSAKFGLGYDPVEMVGHSVFDFIHPDDQKKLRPLLNHYINQQNESKKTGKDIPICDSIEYRIRNKNGEWHFMQSNINVVGDKMLAITRDITNRKLAELKQLENSERQKLVLNALPIVFYTTDATKIMANTWLSEQVKKITGFTSEEMVSDDRFWEKRIHPDDKESTLNEYHSVFELNYVETEYRWKIASGEYKWFQDIIVLMRDEYNLPKQIIGLWIDITDRKQIEDELQRHRENLEGLVKERTAELEEKNIELEHFNSLFVGREFRIKELRDKVKMLEGKLNAP